MAVLGMVSAVAGFVKVRYLIDKAVIDNMVFRMHYRITSAMLFLFCILVTANNLIGDPISCITEGSIPQHVLNNFCWITYTFTLPYSPAVQHAHPGVNNLGNENNHGADDKRIHAYYQWVPFMLFFQGLLFYIPHWIWKNWEEGKVRMISDGIRGTVANISDDRNKRQNRLVEYLIDTLNMHNTYSFGYFFCEALNFINVVGNIFFLDKFLNGAFLTYGTDVVRFSNMNQEQRTDPMIEVFPRLTKCTFHKYGASGSIQKHDSLCVLALNILNEKIFIFLWFWFIILSIVSGLALVYSAAVILLPSTREQILKRRFRFGTPKGVEALVRKTQVGDFLLLHLLGQNMSMRVFGEVLDELSRRLHLGSNPPSAPSTIEMAPIYPNIDKFSKETET
ncbi:innexin inx3 [Cydia fagiglandana]|uniref:innexin inx3 n=1 Tax=Cydia fagiglandana TaxID=1458189 RepID=UPI002FEDF5D5